MLHPEGEIGMLDSKEENGILALQRDCHGLLCMGNWHAVLCIGACYAVLCMGDPYNALQGILPLLLKRSLCYVMLCRGSFCHAFVYSAGEPLPCHALLCRRALVMPFSTLQLSLCDAMLCSVGDPLLCHALFCWGVSYILCSGGGTASV